MTLLKPLWMQVEEGDEETLGFEYSALNDRMVFDAMFPYEGVIGELSFKVSQRGAGANMSVDIAAGLAVIAGDDAPQQGRYVVRSTAVENRTIPAPPVSGTRIHRVVLWVQDKLHNEDFEDYEFVVQVLPDVGSGTPAEPNSAITLALVTVTAGLTAVTDEQIGHRRPYAQTAPGRLTQVGSNAARPGAPLPWEIIQRTDKPGVQEMWDAVSAIWRISNAFAMSPAMKFADSAPRTSTTLADDPDLQCALASGGYYLTIAFVIYSTRQEDDFKWQMDLPSGGTMDAIIFALPPGSSGIQGEVIFERSIQNTPYVHGGPESDTDNYMCLVILGITTGGVGGLQKFKWAPNASGVGTATVVRGKSAIMNWQLI